MKNDVTRTIGLIVPGAALVAVSGLFFGVSYIVGVVLGTFSPTVSRWRSGAHTNLIISTIVAGLSIVWGLLRLDAMLLVALAAGWMLSLAIRGDISKLSGFFGPVTLFMAGGWGIVMGRLFPLEFGPYAIFAAGVLVAALLTQFWRKDARILAGIVGVLAMVLMLGNSRYSAILFGVIVAIGVWLVSLYQDTRIRVALAAVVVVLGKMFIPEAEWGVVIAVLATIMTAFDSDSYLPIGIGFGSLLLVFALPEYVVRVLNMSLAISASDTMLLIGVISGYLALVALDSEKYWKYVLGGIACLFLVVLLLPQGTFGPYAGIKMAAGLLLSGGVGALSSRWQNVFIIGGGAIALCLAIGWYLG